MFSFIILVLVVQGWAIAAPSNKNIREGEVTILEEGILKIREKLSGQMQSTHTAITDNLVEAGKIFSKTAEEYQTSSSDLYIIYQEKIYNLEVNVTDNEVLNCIQDGKAVLSNTLSEQMEHLFHFLDKMYHTIDPLEKALRPNVDETWSLFDEIYSGFKACSDLECFRVEFKRAQDFEKDLDGGLLTIKPKIFLNLNELEFGLKEFTLIKLESFFFELNEVYKEVQKCRVKLS